MTLICLTAETAETALRIFIVHPGRDLYMKKNNLYSSKDHMSVTWMNAWIFNRRTFGICESYKTVLIFFPHYNDVKDSTFITLQFLIHFQV